MKTVPSQAPIKWEGSPCSCFLRLLLFLPFWASLPTRNTFSRPQSDSSENEFTVFQRLCFVCFLRENTSHSKYSTLVPQPSSSLGMHTWWFLGHSGYYQLAFKSKSGYGNPWRWRFEQTLSMVNLLSWSVSPLSWVPPVWFVAFLCLHADL